MKYYILFYNYDDVGNLISFDDEDARDREYERLNDLYIEYLFYEGEYYTRITKLDVIK